MVMVPSLELQRAHRSIQEVYSEDRVEDGCSELVAEPVLEDDRVPMTDSFDNLTADSGGFVHGTREGIAGSNGACRDGASMASKKAIEADCKVFELWKIRLDVGEQHLILCIFHGSLISEVRIDDVCVLFAVYCACYGVDIEEVDAKTAVVSTPRGVEGGEERIDNDPNPVVGQVLFERFDTDIEACIMPSAVGVGTGRAGSKEMSLGLNGSSRWCVSFTQETSSA